MKKINKGSAVRGLAVLLLAAATIGGCSKSPEDDFIGTWNNPEEELTLQFLEDGAISLEEGRNSGSGNYQILESGQMRLVIAEPGEEFETVTLGYRFEEENLVLIAPDGDETVLVRVDD